MGRTNPTYRDYLRRFGEDWQPMRRALREQYQADYDRLLEKAERFADAAGYRNATDPEQAILFSMLLHHEGDIEELQDLQEDVDELEERFDALEAEVLDDESG